MNTLAGVESADGFKLAFERIVRLEGSFQLPFFIAFHSVRSFFTKLGCYQKLKIFIDDLLL